MSNVRSRNTSIELTLRKALWHEGVRYRKNLSTLPGRPDIAITKYRIAIFCDGEFWHGKNWNTKRDRIKTNRAYWLPKIERNIARDNENEKKLLSMGWIVFRFWGEDISKHLNDCVNEIKEAIYGITHGIYYDANNNTDWPAAESDIIYLADK